MALLKWFYMRETLQRNERKQVEEQEHQRPHVEDTIREMAEMEARNQVEFGECQSQRRRLAHE